MQSKTEKAMDRIKSAATGKPTYVFKYERAQRIANRLPAVDPAFDLVFILPPEKHHGWILDAICREIDKYTDGRTAFVCLGEAVPTSKAYFYSHYAYFRRVLLENPQVLRATNLLFYTHPRELWFPNDELIHLLNLADRVVSMSSLFAQKLVADGVDKDRIEVALVGADPEMFQPHQRSNGKVGFCSGYVPRKAADRMMSLIKACPEIDFLLCGKKWPDWELFAELNDLSNFEYIDIPYQNYPAFYNEIDIFVSIAELEGGPVPLLEASMSNAIPICSNTGHARDIITHGVNGFLFPIGAPVDDIRRLILQARVLNTDIRASVEHLTWERFSLQIQALAGLALSS